MTEGQPCAQNPASEAESITLVNPIDLPDPQRREFLATAGAGGILLLAGCLGDNDEYQTYLISFTDQDIEVQARDDEFIWDQADEAGVEIPYRCGVGRCGACTIKYDGAADEVVEHTADQRSLDQEQLDAGWILTCVAYARADFEAVVAHPDD